MTNNLKVKEVVSLKNIYLLCMGESNTTFDWIRAVLSILFINLVPLFFNANALLYIDICVLFMTIMFSEVFIYYYKKNTLASYLPVTKLEYILSLYANGIVLTLVYCLGLGISVILGINPLQDIYLLFLAGLILTSVVIPLSRINY